MHASFRLAPAVLQRRPEIQLLRVAALERQPMPAPQAIAQSLENAHVAVRLADVRRRGGHEHAMFRERGALPIEMALPFRHPISMPLEQRDGPTRAKNVSIVHVRVAN